MIVFGVVTEEDDEGGQASQAVEIGRWMKPPRASVFRPYQVRKEAW
jgi:hypothetical protein